MILHYTLCSVPMEHIEELPNGIVLAYSLELGKPMIRAHDYVRFYGYAQRTSGRGRDPYISYIFELPKRRATTLVGALRQMRTMALMRTRISEARDNKLQIHSLAPGMAESVRLTQLIVEQGCL